MLTSVESVEGVILEEVRELLTEHGCPQAEPTGDSTFEALGLDSIALAELLVRVENRVGIDPFVGDVSIADIRSLRQLAEAFAGGASTQAA